MFPLPVWAKALQRSAAVQLARLRRTLDALTERLREAIARAAGDAVSGAVREVIQKLEDKTRSSFARPPRHKHTVLSPWDEDDNRAWHRAHDQGWDDHSEELLDEHEAPFEPPLSATQEPVPANWRQAAAIGCQAIAWWLRRSAADIPVRTGLVVSALVTLAAYAAGPVVALAGAGVLGMSSGLFGLADIVTARTAAVSPATLY